MRLTLPFRSNLTEARSAAADLPSPKEEPLFDEAMIAAFRRLVLLSRQTIAEGLAGEHRSRRRGSSPEFADFKMYSQGDDFRRIDWSLYARLDEVFVRLSEVTTELSVHVLLDASTSMAWSGSAQAPSKFRYARQLTGALSYVSLWHFDRVAITPFGASLGQTFGPSQGRAYTTPMLQYLTSLTTLGQTDLPGSLDRYVRARKRPGMMVIVSDLLSGEPDEFGECLRSLRSRGWQTIVAHIVDPMELTPEIDPDGGNPGGTPPTELFDLETGERLRITLNADVIARYRGGVNAWLAELEAVCQREAADYLRLQTDWPLQSVVLQLLYARSLVA